MSVLVSRPPAPRLARLANRRMAAARLTRDALEALISAGVLLVAVLASAVVQGYPLVVLELVLVYAVALLSLTVLTGYVGQISLCQASLMGVGAYLVGALMGHYGLSYWVAAPLSIALVFCAGIVIGLPALRLKGLTLAIVTLSLALLADYFLFADVTWLNNNSLGWRITPPTLLGHALDNSTGGGAALLYRVLLAATALAILAVARLRRGRTGKSWFAMRDAEIAASTSGVPIVSMKLLGFGVASALAALAGALYILAVGSVSPDPFNFAKSILLLAIAGIAGTRSLPGAVIGAAAYIGLPAVLQQFPNLAPLTPLIFGAGLIAQVLFAPQGIGGVLDATETRFFRVLAGVRRPAALEAEAAAVTGEPQEDDDGVV
jgi:branched-chain amino acid transport system permease protein